LSATTITPETLARLKQRFLDSAVEADKQPAQVYSRLISWLTNRNKYEDLQVWRQHIAKVPIEAVAAVVAKLAGSGKVVTGILAPARTEAAQ
jgi:hypothetical protein